MPRTLNATPGWSCGCVYFLRTDHLLVHALVILIIFSTVGGAVSTLYLRPMYEQLADLALTVGWKGEDDPLFQCHIKL